MIETLKNNDIIYTIYFWVRYYVPEMLRFFYLYYFARNSNKYHFREIEKYKNIHYGKRCFIVATAPSLDLKQLDMIKNEYSIGVNSLVTIFERTEWRPTYYGVQDKGVEKVKHLIQKYRKDFDELFIGISPAIKMVPHFDCPEVNYLFHLLDHSKHGTNHILRTTNRADKYIYDGFSITFSMIEIAMYMGFKEIILLGVDCDYRGEAKHIDEYTDASVPDEAGINMYNAFCQMREYAEQKGITIINASTGFKLKAFDCRPLETILNWNLEGRIL